MTREVPSEHTEATLLMQTCELHLGKHPELRLLYAIPNGGKRGKITAALLKKEGVKAGVPDYMLPVARGGYHGLYVELKALDGATSREQRAWIRELRAQGYRAEVAKGAGEAWVILREYLRG